MSSEILQIWHDLLLWRSVREQDYRHIVVHYPIGTDRLFQELEDSDYDLQLIERVSWTLVRAWDRIDGLLKNEGAVTRTGLTSISTQCSYTVYGRCKS